MKEKIFVPHNVEGRKIEKEKRDKGNIEKCKQEFKELLSKPYKITPYQDGIIFINENDEWMFDYDVKSNVFWLNYTRVWSVFSDKYSLNYNQIKELTEDTLRETHNLQGVTTLKKFFRTSILLRDIHNLQDVITGNEYT